MPGSIPRASREWLDQNVVTHRHPDYAAVTISLKGIGEAPGDASDSQMEAVADIAEKYAFDEIRVSHEQNLILPHVARADLKAVYDALVEIGLATANSNLITDIIACPGLDYCALANARSIPVAQEISTPLRLAGAAARHRRTEAEDLRLHQRLRPSPCRPYRHSRRREEGRRALPGDARRLGRREHLDRRDHRPRLRPGRDHRRHRDRSSRPISAFGSTATKNSSTPIAASAPRRSRRRSMLAKPRPLDAATSKRLRRSGRRSTRCYGHLTPQEIIERAARRTISRRASPRCRPSARIRRCCCT